MHTMQSVSAVEISHTLSYISLFVIAYLPWTARVSHIVFVTAGSEASKSMDPVCWTIFQWLVAVILLETPSILVFKHGIEIASYTGTTYSMAG